ncbi:MAG: DUF2723 domain-containing protein [bacterium]|nr:DUF2723 domain-containing protein [bacterium]
MVGHVKDRSGGWKKSIWWLLPFVYLIYYLTAYRSITWWDSAEYSLAAATLGVAHPPGSLLLTLMGYPLSWVIPVDSIAFAYNLLAAVLAVLTLALTAGLIRIATTADADYKQWPLLVASASAILTLGFGLTLWRYAIKFTPYVLTPLFTVLIVLALLRVVRENQVDRSIFRFLFLTGLLLGLDISVHRTNLLLAPAVLVAILLLQKRLRYRWRTWLSPILGGCLGLSLHFLIMLMASARPFLNASNPTTLSRFWNYVSLKQYGGGLLVNLWPRKDEFFSGQVMDYINDFADTFLYNAGPLSFIREAALLVGLFGAVILWKRKRKIAVLLTSLFLLSSAGAILYFNVPENFFRSMDRHYLPSFVIFAVFLGVGSHQLLVWAGSKRHSLAGTAAVSILITLLLALPVSQLWARFDQVNASNRNFCRQFAVDILEQMQPNAIILTGGDTDTYPLWYMQQVEKVRPDITILNVPLLNTDWYRDNLLQREPGFPIEFGVNEMDSLQPISWSDTTVSFPVDPPNYDPMLPDDATWPSKIAMEVPPTIEAGYLLVSDQFILNLIKNNQWRRPIYVASSATGSNLRYLSNYLRVEGFTQLLLPLPVSEAGLGPLKENLFEKYDFAGIDDPNVLIETPTRWAYHNLYPAFAQLVLSEYDSGEVDSALVSLDRMNSVLPIERLQPSESMTSNLKQLESALREEQLR